MVKIETTIVNDAGIHCRPSSVILKEVQKFPGCSVRVVHDGQEVELNSILALLGMALSPGDKVSVVAQGEKEEEACGAIAKLFSTHFDFPPK